jgi:hypothetical protein
MIRVPFPIGTPSELEDRICVWVGENSDVAALSEHTDFVEIKDDELALWFRLRFGL